MPLPSGDGLILSDSRILAPDGETWPKGIKPDQEIPAAAEEREGHEQDRQLQKALETLRQPAAAAA